MRIVQFATEFAPVAKAGGLGEVVTGLSKELFRLGHTVEALIPKYDLIDMEKLSEVKIEVPDFKCIENGQQIANTLWSSSCEGVRLLLLEARHPSGYFHRGTIYGCSDDAARFLYFSKAAIQCLALRDAPIDVLHLHDWPVALAALLVREIFFLPVKTIVLTIHNAEYQGKCATWDLGAIGLNGTDYLVKEKLQDDDPAYPERINLLKGGVVYSDAITTVSPSYAKEILTREEGYHLETTFRKYQSKLHGILNGLDESLWEPSRDLHLTAPFHRTAPLTTILSAKEANRQALCQRFRLDERSRPWIGAITRLVLQKGPQLLEEAIAYTLKLGGVFILLGTSPIPEIQSHFNALKVKYRGNPHIVLHLDYDETLSHQIYASLDFLLIPSLYEPCGLTQMIAMRYGAIPIARATGGLKDTIIDCDDPTTLSSKRNGLLFPQFTKASMTQALDRAFHLFNHDTRAFHGLIRNGLQIDWGWKIPAQKYLQLYTNACKSSGCST
ncbi:MAG: glycogen synthase [Chlamydiia bacterium]|nr:glycogen synthase [Chlamydiia bacterium]